MVAICTGPAFATDDAGNLIMAGERRKANPSPCALKDANGLYTDPAGGLWTPDQIALVRSQVSSVNSTAQVPGGASVPYPGATFTFTNSECWAVQVNIWVTWDQLCTLNARSTMSFETGVSNTSATAFTYYAAQQNFFYPGDGAPANVGWQLHHGTMAYQGRIDAHTAHTVYLASRLSAGGAGGNLRWCIYRAHAWGYAVT